MFITILLCFIIVHKHNIDHNDNSKFNGNMSKIGCNHCVHVGRYVLLQYNVDISM